MQPPALDSRPASAWRHLPNAISVLRMVLVVPLAFSIEARCFRLALWLAVTAGVSDGVDGWLARRFHWRSRLGSVLDPAADKLLLVTCFVLLTGIGKTPLALTGLVLGRDLVIAVGALAWQRIIGRFRAHPSWISKCCTTVQILYVLAVLFRETGWYRLELTPWTWLVAALTLASGLDYVVRWARMAHDELRDKSRDGRSDAP